MLLDRLPFEPSVVELPLRGWRRGQAGEGAGFAVEVPG